MSKQRFIVKWSRTAGTVKTEIVQWFGYTFDVIEIREQPQKIVLGQAYDQTEMTVESREELKDFALASLQSGRVCVAPFGGDKR